MNNYRYQAKKLSTATNMPLRKIKLNDRSFEIKWDPQGYPILPAVRVYGCFYAWCIYCDKWHIHSPVDGHRVAHCFDETPYKDKGYILKEVI